MKQVVRGAVLGLVVLLIVAQGGATKAQAGTEDLGVPAYHTAPKPGEKLPPILPADQRWGAQFQEAVQVHAYELAAKIPKVIYQQPCYCYCDRGMGHKSLHSCFQGTHGAACATCLKELYFSYVMTKKGLTPAQIRQRIERGKWKQINLETAASIQ
jgi:hypothetical protein